MSTATLDFLAKKFNLDLGQKSPIVIPDFGRNQLAEILSELGFRVGVEVGVAAGEYLEILVKSNPQMQFYGVDPWAPQKGYRDYTRQKTFDNLQTEAYKRLRPYPNCEFLRKTSMEAVQMFQDNTLDFVYIDADHSFKAVTEDIHEWLEKVRPGGILAGHDFATSKGNARMHVKHVVPNYMNAWGYRPWFILGNEATDEGLIRDRPRSWMYIK